jgi:DNA-binding IclR family transcriptional regulator
MSLRERAIRSDQDYAINAGLRLLKVLEALEGTSFEPVSIQRIQHRTGFTYDFCFRALKTLKVAGYAAEHGGGWQVGPKFLKFSQRFNDLCLAMLQSQDSGISESVGGGQHEK